MSEITWNFLAEEEWSTEYLPDAEFYPICLGIEKKITSVLEWKLYFIAQILIYSGFACNAWLEIL